MSAFLLTGRRQRCSGARALVAVAVAAVLLAPAGVAAKSFSAGGLAVSESGVNTAAAEGCPIESPDGLSLYIASNRACGTGAPDPNVPLPDRRRAGRLDRQEGGPVGRQARVPRCRLTGRQRPRRLPEEPPRCCPGEGVHPRVDPLPRARPIYRVGLTDYPNPTYP